VDLAPNMLATARELFVAEGHADRVELIEARYHRIARPTGHLRRSHRWSLSGRLGRGFVRVDAAPTSRLRFLARRTAPDCGPAPKHWCGDMDLRLSAAEGPVGAGGVGTLRGPFHVPILRKDALASEAAGFTLSELSAELTAAGLGGMSCGHARPLPYLQAHWVPATNAQPDGRRSRPQGKQLQGRASRDAALLRWGFTAKPY
jgi:hypothetical protein